MSNNNIQLPDFLIAELYKTSLVELNTNNRLTELSEVEEKVDNNLQALEKEEKIQYLGENKKGVAVLVSATDAAYLADEDLNFLTNILKACQLNLSDIAIVNIVNHEVTFQKIKERLNCKQILLFDVEPSVIKLPFLIPAFQIQKFDNCTIMFAPALNLLNKPSHEGKVLKTKLWMSLKQVFQIV